MGLIRTQAERKEVWWLEPQLLLLSALHCGKMLTGCMQPNDSVESCSSKTRYVWVVRKFTEILLMACGFPE
jgi:hypothetical protein